MNVLSPKQTWTLHELGTSSACVSFLCKRLEAGLVSTKVLFFDNFCPPLIAGGTCHIQSCTTY